MHPHLYIDLIAWGWAFAAGYAATRLRRNAGAPFAATPYPVGYYAALACGAIIGAFALGTLNLYLSGQPAIGRSIIGALFGGIIAVEIYKKINSIAGSTGGAFVAAFGIGVAIGRIGCFVSGLEDFTYGTPTSLPWGVDFGDGISRHPVQIYEASVMALFTAVYFYALWKRQNWAVQNGFYGLVLIYGAQRFIWEFLKPYHSPAGIFNIFHFVSAALCVYAIYMMTRKSR